MMVTGLYDEARLGFFVLLVEGYGYRLLEARWDFCVLKGLLDEVSHGRGDYGDDVVDKAHETIYAWARSGVRADLPFPWCLRK